MSLRTATALLGIVIPIVLQGCATAPSAPVEAQTPSVRAAPPATDNKQQLDTLFENYFEDNLRASPILATFIGDLALQQLRREAEAELGPKFDVRDFHREVLGDGAVPMDVLEAKVERWVDARR